MVSERWIQIRNIAKLLLCKSLLLAVCPLNTESMTERPAFQYVDTSAAVKAMMKVLGDAPRVAIDTEANSLHNYFDKVCLIQLSCEGNHFIIDPLADIELDPFIQWLRKRVIILHGADFDLRMMRSTFGFRPEGGVFDTMLAAQLLNIERFGLGALVEEFCDITLSKGSQKSNWARRPLSENQLAYAIDDTRFLEHIADILAEQLEGKKRIAWHTEWCNRIIEVTETDEPRDPERVWRIKGLAGLDRRQLAYVRALWNWRDREARRIDRPAFKVMANHQLIEIATVIEKDNAYLNNGTEKLPKNCTGMRLKNMRRAVDEVHRMPKSDYPPLRIKREKRKPIPDTKVLVDSLKNSCTIKAKELELQPSVLAPKAALTAIARHHMLKQDDVFEQCGLMSWQIEQVRDGVERVLAKSRTAGSSS